MLEEVIARCLVKNLGERSTLDHLEELHLLLIIVAIVLDEVSTEDHVS